MLRVAYVDSLLYLSYTISQGNKKDTNIPFLHVLYPVGRSAIILDIFGI